MRETFTTQKFRGSSLEIIQLADEICTDYRRQGFNLTLRQVYYQFVSRDLLPNNDRSYKRLGSIINDARLAGLLDWDHIQDRTRNVRGGFTGWDDPAEFVEGVMSQYSEALWLYQDYRPEVWVEKDALVDVVSRGASGHRVPVFSCRGYVSQSEMYAAAKRFERRRDMGLTPVVIHLGDHDPSGIDMTRDIADRLRLMSWGDVEVRRIALNMDQIEQYGPPPNPAKLTDARAEGYLATHGDQSWELDALEPSVLVELIQDTIEQYVNPTQWREAVEQEERHRQELEKVAEHWDAVTELLETL